MSIFVATYMGHGQHCQVPARKAHRVVNESAAPARYLIVQWGAPYDYFPVEALNQAGVA